MLAFLTIAFALQAQVPVDRAKADSTKKGMIVGVQAGNRRGRTPRETRRIPVTPELLATAFKDAAARDLFHAARAARLSQDSALLGYDAMSYQRISAGLGFAKIGHDRLMFRQETASRVRWQRDVGVWIDVKGARTAIPIAPEDAEKETQQELARQNLGNLSPIPYFPGYEPILWFDDQRLATSDVNERELVNPLAEGSEAYYVYETGDSLTYRLPDNRAIRLRELRVRPRRPKWNVVVGSLWFDAGTGQLVRAAYRLSEPIDIWATAKDEDPKSMDDVPMWVKPMITPMEGQVAAIAVEYGLYEGRFWLPRIKSLEGEAKVSFMHVPFKLEQSFKYASVNADLSLPAINIVRRPRLDSMPDSVRAQYRDSVRVARRAERDSIRQGLKTRTSPCDTTSERVVTRYRFDGTLAVGSRIPCNVDQLATSPDLPKSIYDPGEEIYGAKERDALIAQALSLSAQPPFLLGHGMLPFPTVAWGAQYMRYNRVEGFSMGARAEEQLGGGYSVSALGRLGLADLEPNVELSGARSNLAQTVSVTAYNRLVSASDWGNPLSFGSSVAALLFGRDEGFYYRATGVELGAEDDRGTHTMWRVFVEQERTAQQRTNFTLGTAFIPNLEARRGTWAGGTLRMLGSYGLDPNGLRVQSDFRMEAGVGADSLYGRSALDLTASHGLGPLVGALTLSGGSSVGGVPPQRLWYLGGTQTVRGQVPDTSLSGNAYWLTRVELGKNDFGFRPTVFSDVGWVGNRDRIRDVGRPLSGVGVGMSILDGLMRFDLARGIYPQQRLRFDAYLEARF